MLIEAEVVVYVTLRAEAQHGGGTTVNYEGVVANLEEAKHRADRYFGPIQAWKWSGSSTLVGVLTVGKSAIWIKKEVL